MSATSASSVTPPAAPEGVRDRFGKLMRSALIGASKSGNPVLDALTAHFDADPAKLPLIQDEYPYHLVIVRQAGLDAWLAQPGRESRETGVVMPSDRGRLSDLLLPPSLPIPAPRFAQAGEERREAGYKKWMRCLTTGLIFVNDDQGPSVVWVNKRWPGAPNADNGLRLEVMAPTADRASAIVDEIRQLGFDHSPYKGECVTVRVIKFVLKPAFEERPQGITADDVILPPGLLERVEKHVLGVARHTADLTRVGCHLKRGLLLWGRPGTGKTHTIRYLASQLPEHTLLIMPGSQLENLWDMRDLIPLCQPGIVVLDDVDYIAEDRTMPSMSAARNLYELLETLDGISPDSDMLFVLATNRADTIEPAVAARPGRVDQVAEIPPPDEACRRRLFALYSKDMALQMSQAEIDSLIHRTDGVTGSFFKELLRRATMRALAETGDSGSRGGAAAKPTVTNAHVVAALEEILDPDNPLTMKLMGVDTEQHAILGVDGAGEEPPAA